MTIRQRLGLRLHSLALRLNPQIAVAIHTVIRDQTMNELAAEHKRQRIAELAKRQ